jgi:hypothetical protein
MIKISRYLLIIPLSAVLLFLTSCNAEQNGITYEGDIAPAPIYATELIFEHLDILRDFEPAFERYSTLRDIEVGLMDVRRAMNRVALYSGDIEGINAQEELFWRARAEIEAGLSVLSDTRGLEAELNRYFDYCISIIEAAGNDDFSAIIEIMRDSVIILDEIYFYLDTLIEFSQEQILAFFTPAPAP